VLDCGEDKVDAHPEYGNTICCHAFREQETDFIRQVIVNAQTEYAAEGIDHKIVICHIPFTMRHPGIFDIESDTYAEWTKLLADAQPDLILCGHMHENEVIECRDEKDAYGQPCRVVVGSKVKTDTYGKLHFTGTGLSFEDNRIEVRFTDNALL